MDIHVGEAGWRNEAFTESNAGKMFVFFHTVQRKNNFKSKTEGRPVFEAKIHIKKLVPGDNSLLIDRPMRETDAEEFPQEWARFQQKQEVVASGTPIAAWGVLTDTQQAEFRAMNIFTVDQLANLPDSGASKIMGFNDLRTKARAFLLASKDSDLLAKAQAEKEASEARMAAQDKEMAELRAQLAALSERKKPGRKSKVQEEVTA